MHYRKVTKVRRTYIEVKGYGMPVGTDPGSTIRWPFLKEGHRVVIGNDGELEVMTHRNEVPHEKRSHDWVAVPAEGVGCALGRTPGRAHRKLRRQQEAWARLEAGERLLVGKD